MSQVEARGLDLSFVLIQWPVIWCMLCPKRESNLGWGSFLVPRKIAGERQLSAPQQLEEWISWWDLDSAPQQFLHPCAPWIYLLYTPVLLLGTVPLGFWWISFLFFFLLFFKFNCYCIFSLPFSPLISPSLLQWLHCCPCPWVHLPFCSILPFTQFLTFVAVLV